MSCATGQREFYSGASKVMAMEKRNEINRRERFRRLAETHGIYVIFVIVALCFAFSSHGFSIRPSAGIG